MTHANLPAKGKDWTTLEAEMQAARADDADWRGGRLGVFVHYAGEDVLEVAKKAYAMFFTENGLGPAAFKSLAKFEREVVQMTAGLLSGGDGVRGTMTTGGTESILLAMKSARDWGRAANRGGAPVHDRAGAMHERAGGMHDRPGAMPRIVCSETAHPAFDKSAHLLGMEVTRVPVRADLAPDLDGIARAIDDRTIALVASAPNYPYGMVDPVRDYAALAAKHGLWLHVDACVGGYIAPFARKLGRPIPDFDFAIPEVTTISADCHKYGYAAKGASTLLFRDEEAFSHLAYDFSGWPRGRYFTQTFTGTRAGGAIAAAWAVMNYLGESGYLNVVERILATREAIERGAAALGCHVIGTPQLGITAFGHAKKDIYAAGDRLATRGWFVSRLAQPRGIHLMLNLLHEPVVKQYLDDLAWALEGASGASESKAAY